MSQNTSTANLLGPISTLAFTKNGRYLVSGSSDQTIKILDIENPEAERNFGVVHDGCLVLSFLSN